MSGICGILSLNGIDSTITQIEAISARLERRGPDGTHHWQSGAIALGHTLLATTPEALVEMLPLTEPDSGCTITADARLDNRDELIAALDLGGETRTIGDGELILRAYLRWGGECPTHLLGDFAFAIWDPREQRLFCARDHMGMRQFNYCLVPGKVFAFATEDTAVIAHDAVPKALNEARLADLIDDNEGYDFSSTFFEAVLRLPPAHCLTINGHGCVLRRYWQLRPPPPLRLESAQAYNDAFMTIFTEAVRCRLRHAGGIGAMLSGGLDSSSIVAVAAGLLSATNDGPLATFSAVGPDPATCPETIAIQSALAIKGLSPTFFNLADFNGMADELLVELKDVRNPFEIHGSMLRGIYLTAKKRGVNIVLDGGAGDVVLTSDNRVAAALATGNIACAAREIRGQARFWKAANRPRYMAYLFFSAAWVAFMPKRFRSFWRARRLAKPLAALAPAFARRVRFSERRLESDKHVCMNVTAESARRTQSILHPNLTSGRERFDQLSASFAVECRDPFMDIRLIEFCLSLPPDQLEAGGWPKIILRRSIEALVPSDIAWRRGKEHLGWSSTTMLLNNWKEWGESMREAGSPLHRYLSKEALRELRDKPNALPTGLNMRLFALDRFVRRYGVGSQGN